MLNPWMLLGLAGLSVPIIIHLIQRQRLKPQQLATLHFLDEEDIANAFLVVYGRSKACALNRFGPRTFFTPGPLKAGRIAVLEPEADGALAIAQFNPHTGEPAGRDTLLSRQARLVVQS